MILAWRALSVWMSVSVLAACASMSAHDVGALDRRVEAELRRAGLPGATLAVLRGEHIVLERGYGTTDRSDGTPMPAWACMRIQRPTMNSPISIVSLPDSSRRVMA